MPKWWNTLRTKVTKKNIKAQAEAVVQRARGARQYLTNKASGRERFTGNKIELFKHGDYKFALMKSNTSSSVSFVVQQNAGDYVQVNDDKLKPLIRTLRIIVQSHNQSQIYNNIPKYRALIDQIQGTVQQVSEIEKRINETEDYKNNSFEYIFRKDKNALTHLAEECYTIFRMSDDINYKGGKMARGISTLKRMVHKKSLKNKPLQVFTNVPENKVITVIDTSIRDIDEKMQERNPEIEGILVTVIERLNNVINPTLNNSAVTKTFSKEQLDLIDKKIKVLHLKMNKLYYKNISSLTKLKHIYTNLYKIAQEIERTLIFTQDDIDTINDTLQEIANIVNVAMRKEKGNLELQKYYNDPLKLLVKVLEKEFQNKTLDDTTMTGAKPFTNIDKLPVWTL